MELRKTLKAAEKTKNEEKLCLLDAEREGNVIFERRVSKVNDCFVEIDELSQSIKDEYGCSHFIVVNLVKDDEFIEVYEEREQRACKKESQTENLVEIDGFHDLKQDHNNGFNEIKAKKKN